jgi:hypothetical protein
MSRRLGEIGLLFVMLADSWQRKRRLLNVPDIEEIEKYLSNADAIFEELRQDIAALKNSAVNIGKTGFSSAVPGASSMLKDVVFRVYRRQLLINPNDTAAQKSSRTGCRIESDAH